MCCWNNHAQVPIIQCFYWTCSIQTLRSVQCWRYVHICAILVHSEGARINSSSAALPHMLMWLRRWLRCVLREAGIAMELFRSHRTRAESVSFAWNGNGLLVPMHNNEKKNYAKNIYSCWMVRVRWFFKNIALELLKVKCTILSAGNDWIPTICTMNSYRSAIFN